MYNNKCGPSRITFHRYIKVQPRDPTRGRVVVGRFNRLNHAHVHVCMHSNVWFNQNSAYNHFE